MKRVKGTGITSWELTDELWVRVKDFAPQGKREGNRAYRRKPEPIPPRQVAEGIVYVLRTGIRWKTLLAP